MSDLIQTLAGTPIPTILVVAGILFLLLSVAGKISGHLVVPDHRKKYALIFGLIFVVMGIALHMQPMPLQNDDNSDKTFASSEALSSGGDKEGASLPVSTVWMTSGDFQSEWEKQRKRSFYPVKVEGKSESEINWYRGTFEPLPATVKAWASYHSLTRDRDTQKNKELIDRGYKRIWSNSFIDAAGIEHFQGIWTIGQ